MRVQTSDPVSLSPSQQSPIFFHSGFHSLSLGTTRLLSVHYSLQAQTEPPATQILLVGFFFYTRSFNRPEQKYANLIATVSPPPTLSIIKYSTSVFFFLLLIYLTHHDLSLFSDFLNVALSDDGGGLFCSAPSVFETETAASSSSKPLYWKVTNPTLSPSHLQGRSVSLFSPLSIFIFKFYPI